MTQPNIVEGDYTGIDYGTVDDTQTQSSFATGGAPEVIHFSPPRLFALNCFSRTRRSVFFGSVSREKGTRSEEVNGLEPHDSRKTAAARSCVFDWRAAELMDGWRLCIIFQWGRLKRVSNSRGLLKKALCVTFQRDLWIWKEVENTNRKSWFSFTDNEQWKLEAEGEKNPSHSDCQTAIWCSVALQSLSQPTVLANYENDPIHAPSITSGA